MGDAYGGSVGASSGVAMQLPSPGGEGVSPRRGPRTVALSTAFGHTAPLAPAAILEVFDRAGVGAIVLDAGLDRDRLEALGLELERRRGSLRVLALEAPSAGRTDP